MSEGTHLETAAMAFGAVVIYSIIQEIIRRLFRRNKSGEDYVTLNELITYCARTQAACPAKSVINIIETNMKEMRMELKAEMAEIRKLVLDVIRHNDIGGD